MAAVLLAGCSNAASLGELPSDAGGSRRFTAPYEEVVKAAIAAVDGIGMLLQTVEDQGDVTEIRLTRPVAKNRWLAGAGWGGVGRMLVERTDPVTVRFVYEKRVGINMGGHDSDLYRNYFAKMAEGLARWGVAPEAPQPHRRSAPAPKIP